MMKIIKDELFEIVSNQVSSIERFEGVNDLAFESFRKYFLLNEYSEKFVNQKPIDVFYNKYYFYLAFSIRQQESHGYDAGIEQQEFKILEEGECYADINWSIIEEISNKLKNPLA